MDFLQDVARRWITGYLIIFETLRCTCLSMSTRQKQSSASQTPSFLWNSWLLFVLFWINLFFPLILRFLPFYYYNYFFKWQALVFGILSLSSLSCLSLSCSYALAPPHIHPHTSHCSFPASWLPFLLAWSSCQGSISLSLIVKEWPGPRYEWGGRFNSFQRSCTFKKNAFKN